MEANNAEDGKGASGMFHSLFAFRSTSRLEGMPKRLWKSNSKSQSQLPSTKPLTWIPEGNCQWKTSSGQSSFLQSIRLMDLTEIERKALQQFALFKLKNLNLGCRIEIPKEDSTSCKKTKKRSMLLKKMTASTKLLEDTGKTDRDMPFHKRVFGIPLTQCILNDQRIICGLQCEQNDETNYVKLQNKESSGKMDEIISSKELYNEPIRGESYSLGNPKSNGQYLRKKTQGDKSTKSIIKYNPQSTLVEAERLIRGSTESIFKKELLVPIIVVKCISHIEKYGLHTEGIFRICSSKKRIKQLKEDFDSGEDVKLNEEYHPHDVAVLLKEYFRDLPESLLTNELYHLFLKTQRIRNLAEQVEALRWLVYLLPAHNRDTLWVLLQFLSKVADRASDKISKKGNLLPGNKMDANNLATVFSPNILRTTKTGKDFKSLYSHKKVQDNHDAILAFSCLINHFEMLFQVPAEYLDALFKRMLVENPDTLDILLMHRLNMKSKVRDIISRNIPSVLEDEELKYNLSRNNDKNSVSDTFEKKDPLSLFGPDAKMQSKPFPVSDKKSISSSHTATTTIPAQLPFNEKSTSLLLLIETPKASRIRVSVPLTLVQREKTHPLVPHLVTKVSFSTDKQQMCHRKMPQLRHRRLISPEHSSKVNLERSVTVSISQGNSHHEQPVQENSKLSEAIPIMENTSISDLFDSLSSQDEKPKHQKVKIHNYAIVDGVDKEIVSETVTQKGQFFKTTKSKSNRNNFWGK